MLNGLIKLHLALQRQDGGEKVSTAVVCLSMCLVQRLGELGIEPESILKDGGSLCLYFNNKIPQELVIRINHDGFIACSVGNSSNVQAFHETEDLCFVVQTVQLFVAK